MLLSKAKPNAFGGSDGRRLSTPPTVLAKILVLAKLSRTGEGGRKRWGGGKAADKRRKLPSNVDFPHYKTVTLMQTRKSSCVLSQAEQVLEGWLF